MEMLKIIRPDKLPAHWVLKVANAKVPTRK